MSFQHVHKLYDRLDIIHALKNIKSTWNILLIHSRFRKVWNKSKIVLEKCTSMIIYGEMRFPEEIFAFTIFFNHTRCTNFYR